MGIFFISKILGNFFYLIQFQKCRFCVKLCRYICVAKCGTFSENQKLFKCKMNSNADKNENKWIFMAPKCVTNTESSIVSLPHPKTKKQAKFMIAKSENGTKIFEIKKHEEKPSSWFIGSTVHKDGSMFIATPFDPLFLLLPFLKSANPGKYVLLNQLLTDVDPILEECLGENDQLDNVADSTGTGDMKAFRWDYSA